MLVGSEEEKRELIVKSLKQGRGKVYLVANHLKCSPKTIYNYINKYPEVKEAKEDAEGLRLDATELKLEDAIDAGEAWAICFFLKTKGKSRGYTERQEVEQVGQNGPMEIRVVRDPNWYGNAARLAASIARASGEGAVSPGAVQGSGVRPAVGKNGSGPNGHH